ncbi:MAG: serine hydrolase, partial [Longimicrobiales bacterium]
LLTHRTGLPGTDVYWGILDYDIAEMMRRLRYVEPVTSFRSHWAYQNVVYAIAGVIVERVSGMPWHDFVRTRLFVPLGMTETEPLDAGILAKPNVAVPHDATNDSLHTVSKNSVDAVASVGSVWSSVTDMSTWLRFMLDSARVDTTRLISPATFREIVTPVIHADMATYPALELSKPHGFSYALGWFVQDYAGDVVWMHTGSINGMSAIVGLLPDRRFGVVVLANRDHTELRHALMYRAFDLAAGNPQRDWSAELQAFFEREHRTPAAPPAHVTPHALPLDRYAGKFASRAYGVVRVTHTGDALQIAIGDQPARTLEHRDFEMFRTRQDASVDNAFSVTFVPDGAGQVAALRMFGVTFERERD